MPPRATSPYYVALAHRLRRECGTSEPQTIGVTSCVRREGVSTVAANLAVSAAQLEPQPVLLVDANPQAAVANDWFGLPPSPGLCDFLSGRLLLADCLQPTGVPNLQLLSAGLFDGGMGLDADLARLFSLIDHLKTEYGLVIFDLPVANEHTPCLVVASALDAILLVVETGRTTLPALSRVRSQLAAVRARLLGVVLNKSR